MRILLDECVPCPLRREFGEHLVRTVAELGWSGKKNGELLALVERERFDLFVTADRHLRNQQDLRTRGLAIVVLTAPSNRLADLLP